MTKNFMDNTIVPIELLGMPNILSPFAQFASASRVNMFNHHLSQAMILDKPEFPKIFTGVENNFIPYSFRPPERDFNYEIVAIVPKYTDALVPRPLCPEMWVIALTVEPGGVQRLDYFTVNRYFMGQKGFGWIPDIDNADLLKVDNFLDKHTPIVHSPAIKGNEYRLGSNLNVCLATFPETVEDAFIISQSAADKLMTKQVSSVDIKCRIDKKPLNLYGTDDEEQPLPHIGQIVREDGALFGTRSTHWTTCVADGALSGGSGNYASQNAATLREILPFQDEVYYIEPGSKIVDLTFNINRSKISSAYTQARLYESNNARCWHDIYKIYERYRHKVKFTDRMDTLVKHAIYRMISQGIKVNALDQPAKKMAKNFEVEGITGQPIDFMEITVVYTRPRPVVLGSKMSDSSGAKGVIGQIYPDDWMPVDEDGIRAELWLDMTSPVARNNPGQLYEMGLNRIAEFARRKCKDVYDTQGPEAAFDTMVDFYRDVNPNYADLVVETFQTPQRKKGLVQEAIKTSLKVCVPPFLNTLSPSDDDFWNALVNIKKWAEKWDCKPSRIRYKTMQADGTGKEFVTEAKFSIGSKYMYHLHKIPEIKAPGFATVNHMGVPIKSTIETKYFPVSQSPYRFGDDEFRVMNISAPAKELFRFQGILANSPAGMRTYVQSLLIAEHPTRIKRNPITNAELMESSSVLNLFHSVATTLGMDTKNTLANPADFAINEDLSESIWASAVNIGGNTRVDMFADDDSGSRRKGSKDVIEDPVDDSDTEPDGGEEVE